MKYVWMFSALLLSSCATVDNSYKGTDAGYALITLELDHEEGKPEYRNHDYVLFFYKSKDSEISERSLLNQILKYRDKTDGNAGFYQGNNFIGQVTLVPMKPGEYVLNAYKAARTDLPPLHQDINIPFEIRPNQVTYLGNYHAVETWEDRFLGMIRVAAGAYFIVSDTHDKDLKLAKLLRPDVNLESMNINVDIPELDSNLNPKLVKERTAKFDNQ